MGFSKIVDKIFPPVNRPLYKEEVDAVNALTDAIKHLTKGAPVLKPKLSKPVMSKIVPALVKIRDKQLNEMGFENYAHFCSIRKSQGAKPEAEYR